MSKFSHAAADDDTADDDVRTMTIPHRFLQKNIRAKNYMQECLLKTWVCLYPIKYINELHTFLIIEQST